MEGCFIFRMISCLSPYRRDTYLADTSCTPSTLSGISSLLLLGSMCFSCDRLSPYFTPSINEYTHRYDIGSFMVYISAIGPARDDRTRSGTPCILCIISYIWLCIFMHGSIEQIFRISTRIAVIYPSLRIIHVLTECTFTIPWCIVFEGCTHTIVGISHHISYEYLFWSRKRDSIFYICECHFFSKLRVCWSDTQYATGKRYWEWIHLRESRTTRSLATESRLYFQSYARTFFHHILEENMWKTSSRESTTLIRYIECDSTSTVMEYIVRLCITGFECHKVTHDRRDGCDEYHTWSDKYEYKCCPAIPPKDRSSKYKCCKSQGYEDHHDWAEHDRDAHTISDDREKVLSSEYPLSEKVDPTDCSEHSEDEAHSSNYQYEKHQHPLTEFLYASQYFWEEYRDSGLISELGGADGKNSGKQEGEDTIDDNSQTSGKYKEDKDNPHIENRYFEVLCESVCYSE